MKTKSRASVLSVIVMLFLITTLVSAQYAGKTLGTAYQLVNSSDGPVTIVVDYYDQNGVQQLDASRVFNDVEVGGSRLVVVPKDETNLAPGMYSAVISSSGPVNAIVNQQYYPYGSTNPTTPFASYSAETTGSTTVYVPSILHAYYGYYTEMFIQNVSPVKATNVDISYIPGTVDGVVVGTPYQELDVSIPPFTTIKRSQLDMTQLGNSFFGSVKITSDQPLVVIVNEHNPTAGKLMSFNGFSQGYTKLMATAVLRGWWTYSTTLAIGNTSSTSKACVKLTYNPDLSQSHYLIKVDGTTAFNPVVVYHTIEPNSSLLRSEGPYSNLSTSDLITEYIRFNGSVTVESIESIPGGYNCGSKIPVIGTINNETKGGPKNQAGALNLIPVSSATGTVIFPVILSDYWGYYTVITLANTTATPAMCKFKYTSGPDSNTPSGTSKEYYHFLGGNSAIFLNESFADSRSDIKNDSAFWLNKFIGSAIVECKDSTTQTIPVPVLATVNEEKAFYYVDAMYAQSTFNK